MAIKAGQILHVGNDSVVIDRIQTAGPGNLNIPIDRIYELGNYKSVGTIRDVPDLTFTMESLDVSTEIEALLLDFPTYDPAKGYDFDFARPVEIASQFKVGRSEPSPFSVIDSVGLPFLNLESMGYRFGLRDNARQTVTLRGDSVFYNPGSTYVDTAVGSGTSGQTVVTDNPAFLFAGDGTPRRVLSVTAGTKRLTLGTDYTESFGTVTNGAAVSTITITRPVPSGTKIRVMYASPAVRMYPQSVHADAMVKPAAVRGKDIDVYIGGYDPDDVAGSQVNRWTGVQSIAADYRATLEKDEEFGNYFAVANDFETASVTGSLDLKPADPTVLWRRVRQIAGVTSPLEVVGPSSSAVLPIDIVIKNAFDNNATLKRIHVPDARFTLPGFSGRANTRTTLTFNFESEEGSMQVFTD